MTILEMLFVVGVLLGVYWVFPIEDKVDLGWVLRLVIGLGVTGGLLAFEIVSIQRARRPLVRAMRALVTSLLVFLTVFALTYLALEHNTPGSFSEHLDKVSAMYFAVTTLATVGYGDIVPVTHTAEILTTVQMLLDLVVVAVAVRVLLQVASGAVDKRRAESGKSADGR
jgi:voltage-gated potassium channel Kch